MQVSLSAIGTLDALLEYAKHYEEYQKHQAEGFKKRPKNRRESRRVRSLFLFHSGTVESYALHPENHPQVGHTGRHQEASQPACLQAQRGNPHGERR